jgi:hypothetical protein
MVEPTATPDAPVSVEAAPDPQDPPHPNAAPEPPAASEPAPSREPGGPRDAATTATQSQLRRFIKSRAWIPMHELRRRFGIEGGDDEMSRIVVDEHPIFIGLPPREAEMIGELIRQGEVGYELILDPECPAVAGLYPMRPVVRS